LQAWAALELVLNLNAIAGMGKKLQDHPAVAVSYKLKSSVGHIASTDDVYNDNGNVKWSEMFNWAVFGKGPLTSTGCDRGAFVKTAAAGADAQPDLQLRFINGTCLLGMSWNDVRP
jgi:hypothetical protein